VALQVGELFALLTADDGPFQKVLAQSSMAFKAAGDEMVAVGGQLTAKVTAPILGLGAATAKFAGDFEESSNKLATIADESVVSMDKMNEGALRLSDTMGIAATEINESLYQAISATGDTENALGFVEVAAKAAKGGFTDTATAVDGLSTVMNAYGLVGTEALTSVSDQMLMAQNFGKTTFGEMASGIGNVIPIAASLDVSTQELFASLATLTKSGIQTGQAITGLKAAYSNIIKPSSQAAEMAEELGLNFSSAHLKSVGWAKFLDEVREKTGGNADQMAQLFGSVEALNAVTVLATTGAEDFDAALEAMGDSAGSTQEAFDTMDQGLNNTMDKTLNSARNLGIEFGEILLPYLNDLLNKIKEGIDWFKGLDDSVKENIVAVAGIVAAIGPALVIFGNMFKAVSMVFTIVGQLTSASGLLAGAIGFLASPMGLIVIAIAGLVAAFKYLWDTNEEFRNFMLMNWEIIKQKLSEIWDTMSQIAIEVFEILKDFWATWGDDILQMFTDIWILIVESIQWFLDLFQEVLNLGLALIQGDWSAAWEAFKSILSLIWDGIKNIIVVSLEVISTVINVAWETIKGWLFTLWDAISERALSVFTGIKDGIVSIFTTLKDTILGIWEAIWNGIMGFIEKIKDGINDVIDKIKGIKLPSIGGSSKSITDDIPGLANGGIVTGPTLAMIGEGAEQEAVAPLSKLMGMIQQAVSNVGGSSGMFDGAIFQVRNDDDIMRIANEVSRVIQMQKVNKTRGAGFVR